ncbi:hypothetical protein D3C71_2024270 [compost metagenome]
MRATIKRVKAVLMMVAAIKCLILAARIKRDVNGSKKIAVTNARRNGSPIVNDTYNSANPNTKSMAFLGDIGTPPIIHFPV